METKILTAVGNNIILKPVAKEETKTKKFEEAKAVDDEITLAIVHSIGEEVAKPKREISVDQNLNPHETYVYTSPVKLGDEVLVSKYVGEEMEVEGQKYKVVKLNDIYAVVTKSSV